MLQAIAQTYALQRFAAALRAFATFYLGETHRELYIFGNGHRWNEMERLEDHSNVIATVARQFFRRHLRQVAAFVRRHRPRVVAAPYWSDRHPDHVAASALITEGVFNAGLRKYQAAGEAWKVEWICYYFINDADTPSFVVDVTEQYGTKRRALDCHVTQFQPPGSGAAATRLNTPLFRQLIESRDAQFGALAGVTWAEGVVVREPVVRQALFRDSPIFRTS